MRVVLRLRRAANDRCADSAGLRACYPCVRFLWALVVVRSQLFVGSKIVGPNNCRSEQLYVPAHTLTGVQSPVETRLAASPPPARRGKPRLCDRLVRLAATSKYPAAPHAMRARSLPAT